jgi:hypothetical protein
MAKNVILAATMLVTGSSDWASALKDLDDVNGFLHKVGNFDVDEVPRKNLRASQFLADKINIE